jgi:hypothetical protein
MASGGPAPPNLLCPGFVTCWKLKGELEAPVSPWTRQFPRLYFPSRYLKSPVGWLKVWQCHLHRRKLFSRDLLRRELQLSLLCVWYVSIYFWLFYSSCRNCTKEIINHHPSSRDNWKSVYTSSLISGLLPTGAFCGPEKNSDMHKNVPYTTPLKDASQSSFVYAGKNKARYFLNSGLLLLEMDKIYGFVTMVYWYNCHNSGHYPSSCLLFKTQRFGE